MILRPLVLQDLAAVHQISSGTLWGRSWSREKLQQELQQGKSLGMFSPNLVAFILYRRYEDILEVIWLATDPEKQRRGLMSELFSKLISAEGQISQIWLEVHEKNSDAVDFYCSHGFELRGKRTAYYPDGASALNLLKKLT